MGNHLLSLRVPPPPPAEDERNHPLYYDWSIPKCSLFREPAAATAALTAATTKEPAARSQAVTGPAASVQQSGGSWRTFPAASNDTNNNAGGKTLGVAGPGAAKTPGGRGKAVVVPVSQTGMVRPGTPASGQSVNVGKSATRSAAAVAKSLARESSEPGTVGVVTKTAVGKALVPSLTDTKQTGPLGGGKRVGGALGPDAALKGGLAKAKKT